MSSVNVKGASKVFGNTRAVDDIDFFVGDGEFVSLLGPSGCGKTTILRMIAGLVQPDAGLIEIDGRDVVGLPPYRRNIGMVFQDYALFPHMTVAENIGFGLKMRGMKAQDTVPHVESTLEMVRLPGLGDRYPKQLSGGQQQRIALARAISIKPSVLLLDEPLSNIDLKLRMQMRVELKQLQRRLGITSIFVTHDQGEGLNLSDRVVVMRAGKIEQIGAPEDIYDNPKTRFVAEFMGESNIFDGKAINSNGELLTLKTTGGLKVNVATDKRFEQGQSVGIAVRPEKIQVDDRQGDRTGENVFEGLIQHISYSGATTRYIVEITPNDTVSVDTASPRHQEGDEVLLKWNTASAKVLAN